MGTLKRHIQAKHDHYKPHKCQICVYSATQKSNLIKHVHEVHERIRPFKCNVCNYEASRESVVAEHIRVVHDKKQNHMCKFCDSQFGWKSGLKYHIDKNHLGRVQKKKVVLPKAGTKKKQSKGDVKKKLRVISKEWSVENVKKEATNSRKKQNKKVPDASMKQRALHFSMISEIQNIKLELKIEKDD